MENSKKKILIAAIGVLLIGGGIYFFAGKGAFLKGQASRDLASEIGQPDALENLNLAPRGNLLEPLEELDPLRGNDLIPDTNEGEIQAEQPRVTPETPVQTPLEEPPATTPETPPEEPAHPTENATPPTEEAVPPTENATPATEEAVPPSENATPATEEAVPPSENAIPPTEEAVPPTENAIPASENLPTASLPAVFDTTNFAVTAILNPQKGGTFSLINASTGIRYGQNGAKNSYRISVDFPTYQGEETSYSYDVPLSAVICKESTCASAHTETVTIYKDPFTSDQKYTYLTVTRGELYNAVQTLGASHGAKVDFKMQIGDPNGEIHTSTSPFKQKIEDDALRIAFDLENFKLTKGTYIPAYDGPYIQLDYNQTDGKTSEDIKYFYTGDEASFKFFIEICDAANPAICGNYLEIDSTDIATIGGSWQIPISKLQSFAEGVGFTSGTKLLFKLAVQDNVEGAAKHYAKGFYLYLL